MKQESKNKSRLLKAGILAMLLGMSGGMAWADNPSPIDSIQGKLPSGYKDPSGASDYGWTMVGKTQQVYLQNSSAYGFQNLIDDYILVDAKGNKIQDDKGNDVHGSGSTAIGTQNTIYKSSDTTLVGKGNTSTGVQNSLFGSENSVTSKLSVALGTWNNIQAASGAFAVGVSNTVKQSNALAVGFENTVSGSTSGASAIGVKNLASGGNAVVMGFMSAATGKSAYALGTGFTKVKSATDGTEMITGASSNKNLASGENSLAVGWANNATGEAAIAIGSAVANTYVTDEVEYYDADKNIRVYKLANTDGRTKNLQQKASAQGSIALGIANQATAKSAVAIGDSNEALGQNSLAIGGYLGTSAKYTNGADGVANTAASTSSIAVGLSNYAYGNNSVTIGTANKTNGIGAIAIGSGDADESSIKTRQLASGTYAQVIGAQNSASGDYTLAYGYKNESNAANAISLGSENKAEKASTIAIGMQNQATGLGSLAIGGTSTTATNTYNTASGSGSMALGLSNTAGGAYSISVGAINTANEDYAQAIGGSNTVNGAYSLAYGYANKVYEGTDTEQTAVSNAIAIGNTNIVSSEKSVAVGYRNEASASKTGDTSSIAMGTYNKASGQNAISIGAGFGAATATPTYQNATGTNAIAIGNINNATANSSFAIGTANTASAENALALGGENQTKAYASMAFGLNNYVYGDDKEYDEDNPKGENSTKIYGSMAQGMNNNVFGMNSIAMGAQNTIGTYVTKSDGSYDAESSVNSDVTLAFGVGNKALIRFSNVLSVAQKAVENGNLKFNDVVELVMLYSNGDTTFEETVDAIKNGKAPYDKLTTDEQKMTALVQAVDAAYTQGDDVTKDLITKATNWDGHGLLIGENNEIYGAKSLGFGTENKVYSIGSIVVGGSNEVGDSDKEGNERDFLSMAIGTKNKIQGSLNVVMGIANESYGNQTISVGSNTIGEKESTVQNGIAYGINNKVYSDKSVAIGGTNKVNAQAGTGTSSSDPTKVEAIEAGQSLAMGLGNTVNTSQAIVIGGGNTVGTAADTPTTAAETNEVTLSGREVVIGVGSTIAANAGQSTALGGANTVSAANAVAVGFGAQVSGTNAQALGAGANAKGLNSVALGAGSETTVNEKNVVSVGTSNSTRKIVNVTYGGTNHDAATWGQIAMLHSEGQELVELDATGNKVNLVTNDYDPTKSDEENKNSIITTFSLKTGTIDSGDTGIVSGGAIYDYIQNQNFSGIVDYDTQYLSTKNHYLSTDFDKTGLTKGKDSTAYGYGANAKGDESTALGTYAVADGAGSVALGSDSAASDGNVSFGHTAEDIDPATGEAYGSSLTRKLTNVSAGEANTDAANVGQLLKGGTYDAEAGTITFQNNEDNDAFTITGIYNPGADEILLKNQTVSLAETTEPTTGTDTRTNVLRAKDGTVIATFTAGSVDNGNTGFVSGGDVYSAIAARGQVISGAVTTEPEEGQADNRTNVIRDNSGNVLAVLKYADPTKSDEYNKDGIITPDTINFYSIVDYDKDYETSQKHWLSTDFDLDIDDSTKGTDSTAYGYGAKASGDNSVALGSNSIATAENTVSFGHTADDINPATGEKYGTALNRTLTNVAAGTVNTDAANYGQLVDAQKVGEGYTVYEADENNVVTVKTNDGGTAFKIKLTAEPQPTADSIVKYDTEYKTSGDHWLSTDFDVDFDTKGKDSTAYGYGANAQGDNSVALGKGAIAKGEGSVAIGEGSLATDGNVSFGTAENKRKLTNVAEGTQSGDVAVYDQIAAKGQTISGKVTAEPAEGEEDKRTNVIRDNAGNALVTIATANPNAPVKNGDSYITENYFYTNIENTVEENSIVDFDKAAKNNPDGDHWLSTDFGETFETKGKDSTAFGYGANAQADNSVAIGSGSIATEANTFSVGGGTDETNRRIVNVAAGTANTDAVNYGQILANATYDASSGTVTLKDNNGEDAITIKGIGTGSGTSLPTGQKVSFSDTTKPGDGEEDTRTNVIRDKDDNVIAEFEAGKVEKDNKGFVSGGDVWNNIAAKDQTINGANNQIMANDGTTVLATIAAATDPTDQTTDKDSFTTKEYVDRVITDHTGTTLAENQHISFTDTTVPEEGAEDTRTNVIRDIDGKALVTIDKGAVEKDNKNLVDGGTVYDAIAAKNQEIDGVNNQILANDGTILATIKVAQNPLNPDDPDDPDDPEINYYITKEYYKTTLNQYFEENSIVDFDKAAKNNPDGDHWLSTDFGNKDNVTHGKDSTAYGYGANAKGDESTAIGKDAVAEGEGSVAIGEGSIATGDNEVSFGTEENKRKLTNVAKGEKLGDVAVYDQIAAAGQSVSLKNTTGADSEKTNVLRDNAGNVIATFEKGEVAKDNTGFVAGGDVYNAIAAKGQEITGTNNKLLANDGTVLATIKTYDSEKSDRENQGSFVTYDTIKDTIDHSVAPGQVVTFDNTTDGNPGQTNVIRGEDGKVLVTIQKGEVEKGDTGLVSGGDVYNASVAKNQLIYATTAARTDDPTKQQNIIYDNLGNKLATMQIGTVTEGSTGFVSGGQVYSSLVKKDTYVVQYVEKTNTDTGEKYYVGQVTVKDNDGNDAFTINGIYNGGKPVNAVEDLPYTGSDTIAVDAKTHVISAKTTNEITEGGEQLVTAGTIYNEDRKAIVNAPETYNIKNQSVGDNLVALDTALGKISEGSPDNTDPDKKTYYTISSGDSISENIEKIDAALKETDGLIKLSDDKKQILVGSGDNAAYATTVSFANNMGEARRLTDVAAGVANTDAANVGQIAKHDQTLTFTKDVNTQTLVDGNGDTIATIKIDGVGGGTTLPAGQKVSFEKTDGADSEKTNVIRDDKGNTLVEFEKGKIEKDNTGFVSGGDIYDAIAQKGQTIDGKNNTIISGDGSTLVTIKTYDPTKSDEENKDAFITNQYIDQYIDKSVTTIVNENSIVDFDKNAKGNPDGDHWVSTDFGAEDVTHGKDSTAYGYGSNAKGDISTALGYKNTVEKESSTAVGANNTVSGAHSIAAGCDNDVAGDYAVALGHNNKVTGNNAIVIGKDGTAGKDGIVLGNNSSAAEGSTAIGNDSIAKDSNEVSFGHSKGDTAPDGTTYDADLNRKLTHIADGTDDHDAANVGQVNKIGERVTEVEKKVDGYDSRISDVETSAGRGIAGASALAALHPLEFDPDDKASFAVGYGHFNSSDALALGAFYRPNESVLFSVGGVLGNGENQFNAGISFALGRDDERTHPMGRVEMSRRIQNLQQENAGLNERIDRLERFIAQMVQDGQQQQQEQPAQAIPTV